MSAPNDQTAMRVTGWSNGSSLPAGYGLRVSPADRDRYFDPTWPAIEIELAVRRTAVVTVSPSFWRTCTELHSAAIGRWLIENGMAPWRRGLPPQLELEPLGDNRFRLLSPFRTTEP